MNNIYIDVEFSPSAHQKPMLSVWFGDDKDKIRLVNSKIHKSYPAELIDYLSSIFKDSVIITKNFTDLLIEDDKAGDRSWNKYLNAIACNHR